MAKVACMLIISCLSYVQLNNTAIATYSYQGTGGAPRNDTMSIHSHPNTQVLSCSLVELEV